MTCNATSRNARGRLGPVPRLAARFASAAPPVDSVDGCLSKCLPARLAARRLDLRRDFGGAGVPQGRPRYACPDRRAAAGGRATTLGRRTPAADGAREEAGRDSLRRSDPPGPDLED